MAIGAVNSAAPLALLTQWSHAVCGSLLSGADYPGGPASESETARTERRGRERDAADPDPATAAKRYR